jgi:TrmH family RNA methyltransferase
MGPSQNLVVVLVSTRNPLNIGAVARAIGNFGFSQLRVVDPYEPSFREARSAVGASKILSRAKEYAGVAEAIADCELVVGTTSGRDRKLDDGLRILHVGSRAIRKRLGSGRVGLLFGSEKRGLSNQDLSHCHWLLRIPTSDEVPSMNLGQAVAVCLYEIANAPVTTSRVSRKQVAASVDLERMTLLLTELLAASGYTIPGSETRAEQKLRQMIRRLEISSEDSQTWQGMLRQIQWKLRHS